MKKPNTFAMLIGPPEFGKSSLAYALGKAELEAGSWLFVEDQADEFHALCARYGSTAEWKRAALAAMQSDGKLPALPRGAAIACSDGADELARLVLELGRKWNQEKGVVTTPIAIVLNETSALGETGATHLGKLQGRLINQRRHLGVSLIYCMQRGSQLPQSVWDVVTDVYLFGGMSRKRIGQIEDKLDLDPGTLSKLRQLPEFTCAHWRKRRKPE